jgi:hypothetical protein
MQVQLRASTDFASKLPYVTCIAPASVACCPGHCCGRGFPLLACNESLPQCDNSDKHDDGDVTFDELAEAGQGSMDESKDGKITWHERAKFVGGILLLCWPVNLFRDSAAVARHIDCGSGARSN